jgi:hypothetical protein
MAIRLSSEPLKITEKVLAAETALAKVGRAITNLESYSAEQQVANNMIIKLIERMHCCGDFDLILSKSFVSYLEGMSLEKCKEVLAWSNWAASRMRVDGDNARISSDWYAADDCLTRIAQLPPTGLVDHSVGDYLSACVRQDRRRLIEKKAYWYHLACPDSNPDANYRIAAGFVDEFYAWAKRAVGAPNGVDIFRYKINFAPIISMMEFLILRVKAVQEVEGRVLEKTAEEKEESERNGRTTIGMTWEELDKVANGTKAEAQRRT